MRFVLKFQPGIDKAASGSDDITVAEAVLETKLPPEIKLPKARIRTIECVVAFLGFLIRSFRG